MNPRTLLVAGLLCLATLFIAYEGVSHAATPPRRSRSSPSAPPSSQTGHKLAPPVICNMANRMMIFVDEDNILWACECEALASGFTCRWQVIGGVDAITTRRRIRMRLHVRVVPRLTLLVLR